MGNINDKSRYPNDTTPSRLDFLIGTKGEDGQTTATFQTDDLQSLLDSAGYTRAQMNTLIGDSGLKENVDYKITDAGSSIEEIVVTALSSNALHGICRKVSEPNKIYIYDISSNNLIEFESGGGGGANVIDDPTYASNSQNDAPSVRSVKQNDDVLKGDVSGTGATLTFTKKEQFFNSGAPSASNTVTVNGVGAIAPSISFFISDGTEVTSIVGAGSEVIRAAKGSQPIGEVGMLSIVYDGTAYWPTWRSEVQGGGGGEGTVTSVNNITPDGNGNVALNTGDVPIDGDREYAVPARTGTGLVDDPILFISREGGFTVGTATSPSNAAVFTISTTEAVEQGWAQIFWNGTVAPTFTGATINKFPSNSEAKVGEDNVIYLAWQDGAVTVQYNTPLFNTDLRYVVREETGTAFTIQRSDNGKIINANNVADITVTVDTYANQPFPVGGTVTIKQKGAGGVAVVEADNVTTTLQGLRNCIGQHYILTLLHEEEDVWTVIGGV